MSGPPQSQPPRWLPHQNQPHPGEAAPPALILTNRHPEPMVPAARPMRGLPPPRPKRPPLYEGHLTQTEAMAPPGPPAHPPHPTRRA